MLRVGLRLLEVSPTGTEDARLAEMDEPSQQHSRSCQCPPRMGHRLSSSEEGACGSGLR